MENNAGSAKASRILAAARQQIALHGDLLVGLTSPSRSALLKTRLSSRIAFLPLPSCCSLASLNASASGMPVGLAARKTYVKHPGQLFLTGAAA